MESQYFHFQMIAGQSVSLFGIWQSCMMQLWSVFFPSFFFLFQSCVLRWTSFASTELYTFCKIVSLSYMQSLQLKRRRKKVSCFCISMVHCSLCEICDVCRMVCVCVCVLTCMTLCVPLPSHLYHQKHQLVTKAGDYLSIICVVWGELYAMYINRFFCVVLLLFLSKCHSCMSCHTSGVWFPPF